jgi:HD-like signal output (HDOD) protein
MAIEKDAVISLRLVSVANSPLYRGVKQINTVRHAIPRLGLKQTENIVSAIAHKSIYDTKHAQFRMLMERLWLHSLASAYGARAIAENVKLGEAEQFFMMGLTHDIGKVVLLKTLTETLKNRSVKISDAIAGIHLLHCGFGGAVLQRWGFTEDFVNIAKLHEGPEFSSETAKDILVVNLANNLTRNIGYSLFDDKVELLDLESTRLLGIDADSLKIIGEHVEELMKNAAQLF